MKKTAADSNPKEGGENAGKAHEPARLLSTSDYCDFSQPFRRYQSSHNRSNSSPTAGSGQIGDQIVCICFIMNALRNKPALVQSHPVKVSQSDLFRDFLSVS